MHIRSIIRRGRSHFGGNRAQSAIAPPALPPIANMRSRRAAAVIAATTVLFTMLSGLPSAAADAPSQMNAIKFYSSNGRCLVPKADGKVWLPPCLPVYDGASRWTKGLDRQIRHVETGGCLGTGHYSAVIGACYIDPVLWELHVLGENAGNIRMARNDPTRPYQCLHAGDNRSVGVGTCNGSASQWWTWAVV